MTEPLHKYARQFCLMVKKLPHFRKNYPTILQHILLPYSMCFKKSHIIPIILVLSAIFIALLAGCPILDIDSAAEPVAVSTPPGEMAAPRLVPGDEELTVHWTAPADDGGSPITGYELQYREVAGPAGNWIPEADDPAIIVESTATSHTITGMTNSTEYEVRARAVNVMGKGEWSEPSDRRSPC